MHIVKWVNLIQLHINEKYPQVKGLCGNFNDDERDDFQTPSGGAAETSATIFGDSWRLQDYCAPSKPMMVRCSFKLLKRYREITPIMCFDFPKI